MNRLCTIIAQNYLPQAMALLESTRKVYPEIEFYVLITDIPLGQQPCLENAHVLLPSDLNIDPDWLKDMQSYYDAVEFATSLKPFLINTLLTPEVSTVTFLDPDILLFSELSEGFSAAKKTGIALSPHRLTPAEIRAKNFGELSFLKYGVFNLGYISVGQLGKPMLKWWSDRLRWFCTRFPNDVIFTDQKWMDLVPALFDCTVIRNFGYDVAPWNISERPISFKKNRLYAGEDLLVFIHFSQMSGELAIGIKTKLWMEAIQGNPKHKESLGIISEITKDYSARLQASNFFLSTNVKANAVKKYIPLPSFHQRKKMIKMSLGGQKMYLISKRRTPRFFQSFVKILEKSATLNGVRMGLKSDLHKVSQRFRKILNT